VKYHELPALLLNEVQRLEREKQALEASLARVMAKVEVVDTLQRELAALRVDLIRFRGHLPKGGYDVRNGRCKRPASPSAIYG
jgi:hypothetical protein